MGSFSRGYAEIYDLLYYAKDYEGEADVIEKVIRQHTPAARKILDYGCGTGNHAKALALRGYELFGVDKSENTLEVARQKLKGRTDVHLFHADERDAVGPGSIDVCITLFDVLSYMNANDEIIAFLDYVRNVLKDRGLMIFDFWYGPGVIHLRPEKRWKEYVVGERKILRLTTPEHDDLNCVVSVKHEILMSEKDRIINRMIDTHTMRYFFKNEIFLFLKCCGFEVLHFGTWEDLYATPGNTAWSALVVAQKV